MLQELTKYNTFGSLHHLEELSQTLVKTSCTFQDLSIIASCSKTIEVPRIEASIALLCELGFCYIDDDKIVGSANLIQGIRSSNSITHCIAQSLLQKMLQEGLIPIDKIRFNLESQDISIERNEISIHYSQMRNLLICAGVLMPDNEKLVFCEDVRDDVRSAVSLSPSGLSPETLLKRLEQQQEAGAQAELFVMNYEGRRLGAPLADKIIQVSLVSVSEGYDIASFNSLDSQKHDRFIEVKALGKHGFYLSSNELKTAKRLGDKYCLYLVDLQKKDEPGYAPEIIQDPFSSFYKSAEWRVTPKSYHIVRID